MSVIHQVTASSRGQAGAIQITFTASLKGDELNLLSDPTVQTIINGFTASTEGSIKTELLATCKRLEQSVRQHAIGDVR
jgi:hypothetical protein